MNRIHRLFRVAVLAALFALGTGTAFAQQLTRIAVVDLSRILATLPRDPAALRDFDQKKSEVQAEIDRMSDVIRSLQARKADADREGNQTVSAQMDAEIAAKMDELRDYIKLKQPLLEDLARKMPPSPIYVQQVNRQIQASAEADGYSIVLSLRGGDSSASPVLWYSPSIDITDMVLKSLSGKTQ